MYSFEELLVLNKAQKDKPSTRHIDYLAHYKQVKIVNDIYNGVDTAKQYLFQFPQEIESTYRDRQDRATIRNFVKRAVEAFTGMIFRKPIEVNGYGGRTTQCFNTIDTRNDLKHFTKEITTNVIRDGKAFILVDSPSDVTENTHPYFIGIERSQLINWRKDETGHYTMIVIEEIVSVPVGSFGTKFIMQWRHYDSNGDITIYRKKDGTSNEFIIFDQIETDYNGIPLIEIDIGNIPILYDTAKLNIKHFNRLSHKDRYLTMAALPIPVIWGADIDDDGQTTTAKPALVIGVDEAFIFTSKEDGDFQWRELSGDSINLIEEDLSSITEDITTGILRAADSANTVQKTATEVAMLQAEASDRTSAIAVAVETGLKRALSILSVFNKEKVPSDAVFVISKDFNSVLTGPDASRVAMEAYLLGLISIETFLQSLSDAELISIESTSAEIERIKADKFIPQPKTQELPKDTNKQLVGAVNNTAVSS